MGDVVYIYGLFDPREKISLKNVRYIGKTYQKLNERYKQHLYDSNKNKIPIHFWIKNLKKEGIKPKIFVIDVCNKNNWEFFEKMYISILKKITNNNLLNVTEGGEGNFNPSNKIKIYRYDENGFFIDKFESLTIAANTLNINISKLSMAVDQKMNKSSGGYYWFTSPQKAKKFKFKKTPRKNSPIIAYDLNGKLYGEYKNQVEAEKITGIKSKTINKSLRGIRKKSVNLIFKYKDSNTKILPYSNPSNKTVYQYTKNNNFIKKYESLKEAEKITGIDYTCISKNINGFTKSAGGFIWKNK